MKATEVLTAEHKIITQLLDCLDKLVEQTESKRRLEKGVAGEMIEALTVYADKFHHAKEEEHLFRIMKLKKGFSGGCSPVMVMVREHELGRLYIAGMAAHIEAAALEEPDGMRWFAENARSYVRLLREHIKKEDHCLFPAANRVLSDEEQSALLTEFEKTDSEGLRDRVLPMIDKLVNRFSVSEASA